MVITPSDRPYTFLVVEVKDDGHPYPRPDGVIAGSFSWQWGVGTSPTKPFKRLADPTRTWFTVEANSYRPGDEIEVRVDYRDRQPKEAYPCLDDESKDRCESPNEDVLLPPGQLATEVHPMRAALVGFVLLLAAVGCSGAIDNDGNNGGGFNDPAGPGPGRPGGPGTGGEIDRASRGRKRKLPGSPGPGGPSEPTTSLPDAGAGPDGAAATMPPAGGEAGCRVTITALSPPRLQDLLAGPTSRLRVQARVTGAQAPAMPVWQWQVQLAPLSDVPVTKLTAEGDTVEFPLAAEGYYTIQASAGPTCTADSQTAPAFRPDVRVATYWARVTPPRASMLPTREKAITVGATIPRVVRPVQLSPGVAVAIDPKNAQGQAIKSYIRITTSLSSVRFEGNNVSQAFEAQLDTVPNTTC